MKPRMILLAFGLALFMGPMCFAQNLHMGTWKLNEAKSKIAAGAAKNHTVVYEAVGDQIKVTVDGTDGDGNATHNEWTGKFDGKDYDLVGDPTADTRSYRKIGARTLALTGKKAGKVTVSGRIVVTANGKSRTVTTTGTDAKGKRFKTIAVYDKA
ncbi:MAG TPA: hypothetical protein VKC61_22020 [Pyrinomonadaceae bacterium]|nr:hypothetical protein [Pyrinomonadaceae bacterium]